MRTKLRGYGVGENGTPPRDGLVRALAPAVEPLTVEREDGEGAASMPTLVTTFAVFNVWTEINSWFEGHFMERISPGAFKKTMRENRSRIKVTFNHGSDPQLGDKVLGPIDVLKENSDGAYGEVPLLDTAYNRELIPGLEAGVYGASFRFRVMKEEFQDEPEASSDNPKGLPERTIKELQLYEFGPVTFPAYAEASAGLRSLTDEFIAGRMVESPEQLRSLIEQALGRTADENGNASTSTFFPGVVTDVHVTGSVLNENDVASTIRQKLSTTGGITPFAGGVQPEETETDETRETDYTREDDALAREPEASTPEPEPTIGHSEEASRGSNADTPNEERQMKTIEEMVARVQEIKQRLREIDTEHAGERLSDEERGEWQGLRDELVDLEERIEEARERREFLRSLDGDDSRSEYEPFRPTRKQTVRAGASRLPDNIWDLAEYRARAVNGDDHRELLVEGARRAIEISTFPHERANQEDVQAHIERLLRKIDDPEALARHILLTGSALYARAFDKKVRGRELNPEEQRALSLADASGGYAVPFVLDPTIIPTSNGVVNPLRAISRIETITVDEWKGVSSAGVTASYSAEATESADNAPTLAQPTATVEKAQCFIPFSIEVGQDWGSLQSEMAVMIQDAKDELEATKFVSGLGSASEEPEGLLVGGTAVVTTTAATTLAVGDLYKLEEAIPPRFRPRSSIVGAKAQYNRVRQLDTTGGSSLWARIGEATPARLLDYPAYELSTMPTGLTSGASILTQGDFSKFLIIDRIGLSVELLPHLLGANRRPTGQRGLYAYWRNTSKVLAWQAFRTLKVT